MLAVVGLTRTFLFSLVFLLHLFSPPFLYLCIFFCWRIEGTWKKLIDDGKGLTDV